MIFNFGADSNHPRHRRRRRPASASTSTASPAPSRSPACRSIACDTLDELVFDNADKQAQETGDALLLSEFGATDDLSVIRRNIEGAERHMVSWQYWHYCACDDPTTSGPGVQAVVIDANQPPTGANVKEAKLDVLARAYPQARRRHPAGLRLRRGRAGASTSPSPPPAPAARASSRSARAGQEEGEEEAARRASGRARDAVATVSRQHPQTEVFLPERHYPKRLRGRRRRRRHRLRPRARAAPGRRVPRPQARLTSPSAAPASASPTAPTAWSQARKPTRLRLQAAPARTRRPGSGPASRPPCAPASGPGSRARGCGSARRTTGPTGAASARICRRFGAPAATGSRHEARLQAASRSSRSPARPPVR